MDSGDVIAQMHASFENVALSAKKDGYLVKFFVDLSDADIIPLLNEAIQRIVVLTVARRPRRDVAAIDSAPHVADWLIYPEAWHGSD